MTDQRTDPRGAVVAIGLGNPWLADDGVGPRVIEELRRAADRRQGALPPDTRLVVAGTPSLDLLDTVCDSRALLLVDAVDIGLRPGSVTVDIDDAATAAVGRGDIGELLAAARLTGSFPEAVALVGVQVATIDAGRELSSPVEAALPVAVDASCRELFRMAARTRPESLRPTEPAPPAVRACA